MGAAAVFWLGIVPTIGFIWGWSIVGWIVGGLFGLGLLAWIIEFFTN
jgi:hypothetical protein